jgi:hypothetical protein
MGIGERVTTYTLAQSHRQVEGTSRGSTITLGPVNQVAATKKGESGARTPTHRPLVFSRASDRLG